MRESVVPVAEIAGSTVSARVGGWRLIGAGRWVGALVVVLVAWAFPAGAGAAPGNGMIAYEWSRGGEYELRVMNADGTGIRPLFETDDFARPRFSPDGNAVLLSEVSGEGVLVASLAANDGVRRVGEGLAAWSPTSKRVVYAQYQAATQTIDIHVVGAGGTADELIKTEPDPCAVAEFDSGIWWSAATDRIMYVCRGRLISIEPDGSDRRDEGRLYSRRYDNDFVADLSALDLSYDGTQFAGFLRWDVASWNWTTGDVTDATSNRDAVTEEWVTWAPDGNRVLFTNATPDGDERDPLATAGVTGGTTIIGGAGPGEETAHPTWQPCVEKITETCKPVTLDARRIGPSEPAGPDARPRLGRRAARQQNTNVLKIAVGCHTFSAERCDVILTARAGRLTAARRAASVEPGRTEDVRLKLRRPARQRLAQDRRLRLRIKVVSERSDQRKRTATTAFTMRR